MYRSFPKRETYLLANTSEIVSATDELKARRCNRNQHEYLKRNACFVAKLDPPL